MSAPAATAAPEVGAGDVAKTPAADATTAVDAPPAAPAAAAAGVTGGDGDGTTDKEKASDRTVEQVLEDERKAADGRYKTTVPEKSFNDLAPFERFAKAPDIFRPGSEDGEAVKLGKLLKDGLLFGKSSVPCKDGVGTVITYDAFAPRPKVYNSPDAIEGIVWTLSPLVLNQRGYGLAGEPTTVAFGVCVEERDGSVLAAVYDLVKDEISTHLMWRVINAVPSDELSDATKTKAAAALMAFMEQRAEGFPSAGGARASRKERQNAAKDAKTTAAAQKAELAKATKDAIAQGRAEEKAAAKARQEEVWGNLSSDNDDDEEEWTKGDVKRAFPSYSSLQKKKPKESNEEHASKLKSAALAYGHNNADKSKMKDLRSFLSDKLQRFHASNAAKLDGGKPAAKGDDDDDADPEVLPAVPPDGSDKQGKLPKRDPPAGVPGDDGEWVKLPSSDFANHFYFQNKKTGATQWEDPAASKKKKPPGPPPGWCAPPPMDDTSLLSAAMVPASRGLLDVGSSGGSNDNLSDQIAHLRSRVGGTINLTVNQRGAYDGATIYQQQASSGSGATGGGASLQGLAPTHLALSTPGSQLVPQQQPLLQQQQQQQQQRALMQQQNQQSIMQQPQQQQHGPPPSHPAPFY